MASAPSFKLRRDWIWLIVLPAVVLGVLGSQLGWFRGHEDYEPLEGDELRYVGTWSSQGEQLEIFAQGSANYFSLNEEWRGARVSITPATIVLAIDAGGGRSKQLTITKAPYQEGQRTLMKLDNREFEKR